MDDGRVYSPQPPVQVAGFNQSGWRFWIGIAGGFELEQVAGLDQNDWLFSLEYAVHAAQALLGLGADKDLRDSDGFTAKEIALRMGNEAVAKVL